MCSLACSLACVGADCEGSGPWTVLCAVSHAGVCGLALMLQYIIIAMEHRVHGLAACFLPALQLCHLVYLFKCTSQIRSGLRLMWYDCKQAIIECGRWKKPPNVPVKDLNQIKHFIWSPNDFHQLTKFSPFSFFCLSAMTSCRTVP